MADVLDVLTGVLNTCKTNLAVMRQFGQRCASQTVAVSSATPGVNSP